MMRHTIWHINMTGNPIKNCGFFVLWWKVYIPTMPPMVPPNSANINNVISLILHLPYCAFLLSIHMAKNARRLIPTKYKRIFCMVHTRFNKLVSSFISFPFLQIISSFSFFPLFVFSSKQTHLVTLAHAS